MLLFTTSPGRYRPSKWIFTDLLISGWTTENYEKHIPPGITNIVEMFYWDTIDHRLVYHIKAVRNGRWFGCTSRDALHYNINKTKGNSQYRFIPVDETRNIYQIESAYPSKNRGKRTAVVQLEGEMRLQLQRDHQLAASFEFIMIDNKGSTMQFVLKYVDSEGASFLVGTHKTHKYKWSMLHPVDPQKDIHQMLDNEHIFYYSLEAMDLFKDLEDRKYAIYSLHSQRYMAYQESVSGECYETYGNDEWKLHSSVQFEQVSDNHDDVYFIKNMYKDNRQGHYLGFDDQKLVRYFGHKSLRAMWRVSFVQKHNVSVPNDRNTFGMIPFKVYGFYEGAEAEGGWLMAREEDWRNSLSANESDAFMYSPMLIPPNC